MIKLKKGTHALTSRIRRKICPTSKRSQEEIVGFALIIIIVSVILLFFLSFSLRGSQNMEIQSYEVEGFIQAFLQYTSDCEDSRGFLSVQDLIFSCDAGDTCLEEEEERIACDVLRDTLGRICENSWSVGEDTPIKGYKLNITSDGEEIPKEGGIFPFIDEVGTSDYKGAMQNFMRRGKNYDISFKVYY